MRFIASCLFFMLISCFAVYAQHDSVRTADPVADSNAYHPQHMAFLDSVAQATVLRQQFMQDSVATMFIMPDTNRTNQFTAYLLKNELYRGNTFLDIPYKPQKKTGYGHNRKSRDPWIIIIIIGLILYTALLNVTLGSDIKNVFQSLYNKRPAQFDKEERRINLWTFLSLFLLFGLTFGLFLYQLAAYNNVYYNISGLQLFGFLSFIVIVLFSLKFLVLKFIAFLFDINRVVGEYITALYLTYFNIAFLFLPVALCFSLLAAQFIPYLLAIALLLIVIIFIWIYLRSSVNIISNFRFHKFYLFVYLCALEICPILILVKILDL
jgi:hypothetical protein